MTADLTVKVTLRRHEPMWNGESWECATEDCDFATDEDILAHQHSGFRERLRRDGAWEPLW